MHAGSWFRCGLSTVACASKLMKPARGLKQWFFAIWEDAIGRRHSGRRHLKGIWEEAAGKKHPDRFCLFFIIAGVFYDMKA